MIRKFWSGMSYTQRVLSTLAVLLCLGIAHWACVARITYDEGYMLDVIAHFPTAHVMQVVYNGRWGTRWVVTTGPTVSLPLGLLASFAGAPVVLDRLIVFGVFLALFGFACRLARLSLRTALVTAALFFLWVLCLVWRPDINGSSINLIANVFGEGTAFVFALLANLTAASERVKVRRWTWVCAALAIGAKSVALIAVTVPLAYLCWQAWRRRSLAWVGLSGLATAVAIIGFWNIYLIAVLGWDLYLDDWYGLYFWMGHGGGYNPSQLFTLTRKYAQLVESNVLPGIVLFLTLLPAAILLLLRKTGELGSGKLLDRLQTKLLLRTIGLYYLWYIFLAGRGWMRHLWIGYALLGWLVSALLARKLESERRLWPQLAAFTFVLVVIAFFFGTLPALGPMGPTEVWATQKELADELSARYPHSRLMVADWRAVSHISYFMHRTQYNMYEVQPIVGDLFLCDTESGCDEKIFGYCQPRMTEARVAYCLYDGSKK